MYNVARGTLKQLKQALQAHRQALEKLESALVEFEETIAAEASLRPQVEEQRGGRLLSIAQVCQAIGMGKRFVYRRLRTGDIPSPKLGRTIKVRRDALREYLERHRYPGRQEAVRKG